MELKDILAISGKPGLFKFISQGRNGIIVESLIDNKRMNAHASMKISSLEDIAIFTSEGEVPLAQVMRSIQDKENGGESINHKSSSNELTSYFKEVLPDYDADRVYTSDIKKLISWYNTIQKLDMLDIFAEKEEESAEEVKEEKEESSEEK